MKYKLIAADMDGTLLDSRDRISEETVREIQRVTQEGVIFTIASGRPIQGLEKYNRRLKLKGPFITYNGAVIVEAQSHEVLFERGLLKEDARRIIELGLAFDTTMCIWSAGRLFGNKLNDRMYDYQTHSDVEPVLAQDYEQILNDGITKILWYDDPDLINRFQQQLDPGMFSEVTYCTSGPTYLELFSSRVSKSGALKKIGEMYGIKPEEMIAIGDGLNDLDMIRYAGLGIAMGNAAEEVKRNAGYITASNDEDGLRKALEKFF